MIQKEPLSVSTLHKTGDDFEPINAHDVHILLDDDGTKSTMSLEELLRATLEARYILTFLCPAEAN